MQNPSSHTPPTVGKGTFPYSFVSLLWQSTCTHMPQDHSQLYITLLCLEKGPPSSKTYTQRSIVAIITLSLGRFTSSKREIARHCSKILSVQDCDAAASQPPTNTQQSGKPCLCTIITGSIPLPPSSPLAVRLHLMVCGHKQIDSTVAPDTEPVNGCSNHARRQQLLQHRPRRLHLLVLVQHSSIGRKHTAHRS